MTATILRLLLGLGLFALGYYVGREIGRLESLREEMRKAREEADHTKIFNSYVSEPPYAGT